jgi:hypothetical protein
MRIKGGAKSCVISLILYFPDTQDVFSVQTLVESLPLKIGAAAASGNTHDVRIHETDLNSEQSLVISTVDGALLLFAIQETPNFTITLVESKKAFTASLTVLSTSSSSYDSVMRRPATAAASAPPRIVALELVQEMDLLFCLAGEIHSTITLHRR